MLLVQEAGGTVTDYDGEPLDVSTPCQVAAANGLIGEELLAILGK